MEFIKGEAVTGFPFGLVKKASGDAFLNSDGTPTVYITIDGGIQATATNAAVHEGNGQWTVNFNGGETNGDLIGILVTHADVVPVHFAIATNTLPTTVPVIAVTVSGSGTSLVDNFEYYGLLLSADLYFENRLNSDKWTSSTVNDRQRSLIQATRAIDKLNYANVKNVITQNLQFPRGDDTVVPREIEYANYEIGIKLLEGVDLEIESDTLGILSETYSGVRSTYDADFVNEHMRAGIPSIEAWEYLKPFLMDQRQLKLSRVN